MDRQSNGTTPTYGLAYTTNGFRNPDSAGRFVYLWEKNLRLGPGNLLFPNDSAGTPFNVQAPDAANGFFKQWKINLKNAQTVWTTSGTGVSDLRTNAIWLVVQWATQSASDDGRVVNWASLIHYTDA